MAGRWSRRCCHVPRAGVDRRTGSTGGSGPGAPSWNAPTARDAWGSGRRGMASRRGVRRHGRGSAAHLTSPMRGVRCVSMRARAVTWRRHWSIRCAGSETDAWRRVWQAMSTGGSRAGGHQGGRLGCRGGATCAWEEREERCGVSGRTGGRLRVKPTSCPRSESVDKASPSCGADITTKRA